MAIPALIRIDGNEKILIDRPSIMIGRSRQRADFQIDDPTVSSVHCELKLDPSGLTVRDLSRHGTLVNGRKVDSARLREGDIVEIVGFRFQVTFDAVAPPVEKPRVQDEWFVRMAGLELGPMPWDELVGMAQRSELQPDDQIRKVSGTEWQPAGKQKRLFETAASDSTDEAPSEEKAESAEQAESARTRNTVDDSIDNGLMESGLLDGDTVDDGRTDDGSSDGYSHSDSSVVIHIDEIAEEEVAALTDEAATKPTFRLEDSDSDPRNPMADTMVQGGTVAEPHVFRKAIAAVDALSEKPPSEAPPEEVSGGEGVRAGDTATDTATRDENPPPAFRVNLATLPASGWYYRHGNSEFGPVDLDGLFELAQAELLLPDDSVRLPDSGTWVLASDIPSLFSTDAKEDSVDDGAAYDDSSFSDLHDETAADWSSPPTPIAASTRSQEPLTDQRRDTGPAMAEVDLTVVAPPLEAAARPGPPSGLIQKIGVPVIQFARSRPRITVGLVVVALAGVLMSPGDERHEAYVSGQIQLNGIPLKNATITFVEPNSGWGASANLDENGRFEITTLRGGPKPGSYNVSLMPDGVEPEEVTQELQRQYRQQRTSLDDEPSTVEIGRTGEVDSNQVEPEENPVTLPHGTIPIQYRSAETSGLNAKISDGPNDVSFNLASN